MRLQIFIALCAFLQVAQAKVNYAYVANYSANTVSVINTANNTLLKTIPVGTTPTLVAVNQAGTFVYVANQKSNNVSVISTSTNSVVATIPVGSVPVGVAFAPNGKTAYVSNSGAKTVSVINVVTKAVTNTVSVGSVPQGLAVTPNGTFVYVANNGSNNVSVISTLTNKVVATVSVCLSPFLLAISPDGYGVYVPCSGSNQVDVIRIADNTVVSTINLTHRAYAAAVSPDDRWVYVASGGAEDVVTVIDNYTFTVATTIVVGTSPQDVAFTQDSAFAFVPDFTSNDVTVIDTASQTVKTTITGVSGGSGVGVMGTLKVSTVAGGYVGDHGAPTNAAIGPQSTVLDAAGNRYISDSNRIRKIDPSGTVITTYAGNGICGYNGDAIPSTKAMLCGPNGLALDPAGNLIVADGFNHRIRRISKTGTISTIAGNGVFGYSGDGASAVNASIGRPAGLAYDTTGNLYFSQPSHCVVRKVDTTGTISTVAGKGICGFGGDGGAATAAKLFAPRGVTLDGAGNLYIADAGNHRVRRVSTSGIIATFAGTGNGGYSGDGGPATSANIGNPTGLAILSGVLYISNGGVARVRSVDLSTDVIHTYAGEGFGYDGDGHALLASRFQGGNSISFDSAGNPFFGDSGNGRLRKGTGGIVNTIAGGYVGDGGKATSAALVVPGALTISKSGTIYIADISGNRVRKISAGIISTIAGNGITGYLGDGGPATNAELNDPDGVALDSGGDVFIADFGNNVIREVNTSGNISTFATSPNFSGLGEMAADAANNLYVADFFACVVWKITPSAVVSIAAGVLNTCGYNGDGIAPTTAQLNSPNAVALDPHGNLLIADSGNNRLRQVTSGTITTIAGTGACGYSGDGGSATAAELCYPDGVATNSGGTIFLADNNSRIRQISGGVITAFAGSFSGFNGDGLWPLYTGMDDPIAVAVDSKGAVYVLDDVDSRVRKIQ